MEFSIAKTEFYQDLLLKMHTISNGAMENEDDRVLGEMHIVLSCMVVVRSVRLTLQKFQGNMPAVIQDLGLSSKQPLQKLQSLFNHFSIRMELSKVADMYAEEMGYDNFTQLDKDNRFFILLRMFNLAEEDINEKLFDWEKILTTVVNVREMVTAVVQSDGDYGEYVRQTL